MCNGTECVPLEGCDAERCPTDGGDPGRCLVGECQGDACASVSSCTTGQRCCGAGCATCAVLPDMPCVENVCQGTECGTQPLARGTECFVNGLFCDGFGTCDGEGSCVDTSQCEQECDEDADQCVGCLTDAGCPPDVEGNVCTIGAEQCSASVTPMRTTYTCLGNLCDAGEPTPDPVMNCAKDDGDLCGTGITDLTPCAFADDDCSVNGTRERTITRRICQAGACITDVDETTLRDRCDRSTDGAGCAAAPDAPVGGGCMGFVGTCGEVGSELFVPFVSSCASGTCNPRGSMGATFSNTCNRDQGGVSCAPGV
ncbi:MAG: hypothetical protein ACI9KE_004467, partial [Polyangiales bacterium]